MEKLWRIGVNAPLDALTYTGPPELNIGQSVRVPLRNRTVDGVILGEHTGENVPGIRPLDAGPVERPALSQEYIRWAQWISEYYVYPVGKVLSLAFPPLSTRGRGSKKKPVVPEVERIHSLELSDEQEAIFQKIRSRDGFSCHLIHGITGSGKTEIYIRLFKENLKKGKSSLLVLPEIALTPQMIQRLAAHFGDQVAVLHSQMTPRERTTHWWNIVRGEKKILAGARSALFCPLPNLGLIVIDEEHDSSFKQDEKLRYNARDSAIMRAKLEGLPIVLGSATPSAETWYRAKEGSFSYHHLSKRYKGTELPTVTIVDLKSERESEPHWLSETLRKKLASALEDQKQAALFINRRGTAGSVTCTSCGKHWDCPNCSISLTLHGNRHLVCHYCDYAISYSEKCTECGEVTVQKIGLGTEQVELDVRRIFPEARLLRIDSDEITSREDLEKMVAAVENHEVDILIGTQMISKGLDFKKLDLVGIVLADIGFHMPDFRATERAFQLHMQVSGRAGRHRKGEVVLQTYQPLHPSVTFFQNYDFDGFMKQEIEERALFSYPPLGRIGLLRVVSNSRQKADSFANSVAEAAKGLARDRVEILGPAEAPIAKIRNKYRFHILLKAPRQIILSDLCRRLLEMSRKEKGVVVTADIDPLSML